MNSISNNWNKKQNEKTKKLKKELTCNSPDETRENFELDSSVLISYKKRGRVTELVQGFELISNSSSTTVISVKQVQ